MEFAYLGGVGRPLMDFDSEPGSARLNGGARNNDIIGGNRL